MFRSSGYFRHLDCPFLLWGLCERPHCHFAHSAEPLRVNYIVSQSEVNSFSLLPAEEYNPTENVSQEKPFYSPAVSVNTGTIKSVDEESSSEEAVEDVAADESEEPVEDVVADESEEPEVHVTQVSTKDQNVSTEDLLENNESQMKGTTKEEVVTAPKEKSISAEEMKKIIFDSSSDDNTYENDVYRSIETASKGKNQCKMKRFKHASNVENNYEETFTKVNEISERRNDKNKKSKRLTKYSTVDEDMYRKRSESADQRMTITDIVQKRHKTCDYQRNYEEKERRVLKKKDESEQSVVKLKNNKKIDYAKNEVTKGRDEEAAELKVKKDRIEHEKTNLEKEYEEMEDALLCGRMRGRKLATVDILRLRMILAQRDKTQK